MFARWFKKSRRLTMGALLFFSVWVACDLIGAIVWAPLVPPMIDRTWLELHSIAKEQKQRAIPLPEIQGEPDEPPPLVLELFERESVAELVACREARRRVRNEGAKEYLAILQSDSPLSCATLYQCRQEAAKRSKQDLWRKTRP